jgi:hypothetical protein
VSRLPLPRLPARLGPVEELPDWLAPVLAAVLADLQRPTALELAAGWTDGEPGTLWLQERGDRSSTTGVPVWRDERAEMLVQVADQLQEQFFPETSGAWGQARPACPGHAHPAAPRVEGSTACWTCPTSGQVLGEIGALESAR